MNVEYTSSTADFSDCMTYRYRLYRIWGNDPMMAVIGLNPSTADATEDDPTIRRCVGFARRENFGGLIMGNLYALRSTDPKKLKEVSDPVGPQNIRWLYRITQEANLVIAAWGGSVPDLVHANWVRYNFGKLFCLGRTKSGQPKHPLYLKADTPLEIL